MAWQGGQPNGWKPYHLQAGHNPQKPPMGLLGHQGGYPPQMRPGYAPPPALGTMYLQPKLNRPNAAQMVPRGSAASGLTQSQVAAQRAQQTNLKVAPPPPLRVTPRRQPKLSSIGKLPVQLLPQTVRARSTIPSAKPIPAKPSPAKPSPADQTSFKLRAKQTIAGAKSRWDREPAAVSEKVSELRQSVTAYEKKNQELQKAVSEFKTRAEQAENSEGQMGELLGRSKLAVDQLKSEFEVLKAEAIHAHQELEVIADENSKAAHPTVAAASALKKFESTTEAVGNQSVVQLAELASVQSELDVLRPQLEAAKTAVASLKQELRTKENQLKETMIFNKKSMSVTAKLNECVKQQERELSELKWVKGMQENDLREQQSLVEALQVPATGLPPTHPMLPQKEAQAPAAQAPAQEVAAELSAKDVEIAQLQQALQASKQEVASLRDQQLVHIPWNAAKLTASATEYLGRLTNKGLKRKLADRGDNRQQDDALPNKQAARAEPESSKVGDGAMGQQQSAVAKLQRSLMQQQRDLQEEEKEANLVRKRCLEARIQVSSNLAGVLTERLIQVLREQQGMVGKLLDEVKAACQASEQTIPPLKESVASLTNELDSRRAALIEAQLTSQLAAPATALSPPTGS